MDTGSRVSSSLSNIYFPSALLSSASMHVTENMDNQEYKWVSSSKVHISQHEMKSHSYRIACILIDWNVYFHGMTIYLLPQITPNSNFIPWSSLEKRKQTPKMNFRKLWTFFQSIMIFFVFSMIQIIWKWCFKILIFMESQ